MWCKGSWVGWDFCPVKILICTFIQYLYIMPVYQCQDKHLMLLNVLCWTTNYRASTTLVLYGSSSGMLASLSINHDTHIPQYYYWWELNLAVESKITIATVLADFNLGVRYGIVIRIYMSMKYWCILIWRSHRQTAKPPNLIPHQIFWLYSILVWEDNLFKIVGMSQYSCFVEAKKLWDP